MKMLPSRSGVQVVSNAEVVEQPSRTYYIDKENKRIIGINDDYLKSVEQAVYLILRTERYDYAMFSWNCQTLLCLFIPVIKASPVSVRLISTAREQKHCIPAIHRNTLMKMYTTVQYWQLCIRQR